MPEMSGSYEKIRLVPVYTPNGNLLGKFHVAPTDDPDPTVNTVYITTNGREIAVRSRRDGAYVASEKDIRKLREYQG